MFLREIYYKLKPLIPRSLQIYLRRKYISRLLPRHAHVWPIDEKAAANTCGLERLAGR